MRDALKDIKNDFFHELTAIGYNQDSTCVNEKKGSYYMRVRRICGSNGTVADERTFVCGYLIT
jgi:hypothetical protein